MKKIIKFFLVVFVLFGITKAFGKHDDQKQTEENQPRTYDTRIREEIHKIFRFVCYDEKYKPFKYN